jgi:hypothetical protein
MNADRTLETLMIEVFDTGFEADDLTTMDEKVGRVLPWIDAWVFHRAGGHPVPPDLVNRLIAEAMLAQWDYDAEVFARAATGPAPREESPARPVS